jgi:tetratricopeptide (TPR) repeat protein
MPIQRSFRAIHRVAVVSFALHYAGAAAAEPPRNHNATASIDQAKNAYEHGVSAYKAGRYRDAIDLFSSADRLAPRPALAFNIARAYDKLNETGPALSFYREYLRRGAEAGSRASVERRVRELSALLATRGVQQLTVLSTPDGAALSIDGRAFGTTPATLELPLGAHQVTVNAPGLGEQTRNVELGTHDAVLVEVELGATANVNTAAIAPANAAPAQTAPSSRVTETGEAKQLWPAWVAFGAGGVALTGAAVAEVMRSNAVDAARAADAADAPQIEYDEKVASADTYQTSARVLLGVGGALVVVGGALLWFQLSRKPEATTSAGLACGPIGCAGALRVVY